RLPERVAASASSATPNDSALHALAIMSPAAAGMTPLVASARARAASKSSMFCRNVASSHTVRIAALDNIGASRGERDVLMARDLTSSSDSLAAHATNSWRQITAACCMTAFAMTISFGLDSRLPIISSTRGAASCEVARLAAQQASHDFND